MLSPWRLWKSTRSQDDFAAELDAHLQLEADRLQEQGLSAGAARAEARRRFGNVATAGERFYESRRWLWLDRLAQDVRGAVRMARTSPGFTAVAVLTTALGIGATTAIFSVVDATLLHPLPYPHAEQLVTVQDDLSGSGANDVGMSEPEWQDLERSGIFDHVSPTWFDENNLTDAARPERVRLLIVAPNYFTLLGVAPAIGRAWNPADHSPGILEEVVISDGLWEREFGRDPRILERSLRLDTDLYHIVGVLPPGFDAPGRSVEERGIEVWAATSFYGRPMLDDPRRAGRNLPTAVARVKPGLTIEAAQGRVDALVAALRKEFPGDYPESIGWRVRLVPLQARVVGSVRQSLVLLLAAVGVVLLIGCVNVANLLLARAAARQRELAMRQALGAARGRIAQQLLTESVLLSLAGGLAGLAVLALTHGLLLRLVPETLPRLNAIGINGRVLLFAMAASLATGTLFGLAPALHLDRPDLAGWLRQAERGSGGPAHARTRRALVVAEFALSLTLMVAAGLLLRSVRDLAQAPLGFDPANVMTIRTRLPYPNDPKIDRYATPAQQAPFLRELIRRARSLPGVEDVALGHTAAIPLDEMQRDLNYISDGQFFFEVEGRDGEAGRPNTAERSSVTPEYFRLLGIPVLRGRGFADTDTDATPGVAIVNDALARNYWPGGSAIGRRFRSTRPGAPWITVVGVAADARTQTLAQAGAPEIYLNLYQTGGKHLAMLLRGRFDAAAIADQVRAQVQAVDATLPVFDARMLDDTVSAALSERRFSMRMVALFALTALALAAIGIYGVIAFAVSARTREIGIRVALGAQPRGIMAMVLREGLQLTMAGAAVGLVCALIVSYLMRGLLYGVTPTDPWTFAGVTILFSAVALLACYVPARRAVRLDPLHALRAL